MSRRAMMTACVLSQWTKCRIVSSREVEEEGEKEKKNVFYHELLIVYARAYY
jgi:hypothetical protein